jgi:hypothetical protein
VAASTVQKALAIDPQRTDESDGSLAEMNLTAPGTMTGNGTPSILGDAIASGAQWFYRMQRR